MSTNLVSYELNGVKESFANWISNISPTDTPFTSMTGKEAITNKYFQWQHDVLGAVAGMNGAAENAHAEGEAAGDGSLNTTTTDKNVTQILRKVVSVSDTADAMSSYGRGSELAYQMEKAGAELKRDIEWALLNNTTGQDVLMPGTTSAAAAGAAGHNVRKTRGFSDLVSNAAADSALGGTAAGVKVKVDATLTGATPDSFEDKLFELTQNLYLAGASNSIIMFHPTHAKKFSALMESTGTPATRIKMFDGAADTTVNSYVSTLIDPLGQEYKLIPNRFMPANAVYVFEPSDWTQMVLRAPQRTKLAKTGNFEKWMIETEIGLRHRNPFASGILNLK